MFKIKIDRDAHEGEGEGEGEGGSEGMGTWLSEPSTISVCPSSASPHFSKFSRIAVRSGLFVLASSVTPSSSFVSSLASDFPSFLFFLNGLTRLMDEETAPLTFESILVFLTDEAALCACPSAPNTSSRPSCMSDSITSAALCTASEIMASVSCRSTILVRIRCVQR